MTKATLAPIYRGDTKAFNLSFKDSTGLPIDISNHELWLTMKTAVSDLDSDAVFQKRIVFPENSTSQQGIGMLTLSSDETGSINPGTYFFDIQKVIPDTPPVVATLMSGKISILSDITQNDGS
jgi:hypothetical protein